VALAFPLFTALLFLFVLALPVGNGGLVLVIIREGFIELLLENAVLGFPLFTFLLQFIGFTFPLFTLLVLEFVFAFPLLGFAFPLFRLVLILVALFFHVLEFAFPLFTLLLFILVLGFHFVAFLFPVLGLVLGFVALDLELFVLVLPLFDFTFEVEDSVLEVTDFVFELVVVAVELVDVGSHLDFERDGKLPLLDHLGFTLVVSLGLSFEEEDSLLELVDTMLVERVSGVQSFRALVNESLEGQIVAERDFDVSVRVLFCHFLQFFHFAFSLFVSLFGGVLHFLEEVLDHVFLVLIVNFKVVVLLLFLANLLF
jgi:hypothetical protein